MKSFKEILMEAQLIPKDSNWYDFSKYFDLFMI